MIQLKKYVFILLLLGLLVPAVQDQIKFMKMKGLFGAFETKPYPEFSWSDWYKGIFQPSFESAIDQNMRIRPAFVRVNNQINYSLFNLASAKSVVVGKEGYLFEDGYINSYLGLDGPSEGAVRLKIEKAKYVQRELEKKGKHMLILLVPGKGSFYPEYIPNRFHVENKKKSYYDLLTKHLPNSGLNYIDLREYFLKLKNKTPYPLYPKQGIHWSNYGASLAMDTVIKYIKYNFNFDLPTFSIKEIEAPNECRDSDYDIGTGMNLIFKMPHNQMGYPKIVFNSDSTKVKPNVLTIGDSYFWTMMGLGINRNAFNNSLFWYYNRTAYEETTPIGIVDTHNLRSDIDKQDVVILLQTEVYYNNIGMGFIESAYSLYKNNW